MEPVNTERTFPYKPLLTSGTSVVTIHKFYAQLLYEVCPHNPINSPAAALPPVRTAAELMQCCYVALVPVEPLSHSHWNPTGAIQSGRRDQFGPGNVVCVQHDQLETLWTNMKYCEPSGPREK